MSDLSPLTRLAALICPGDDTLVEEVRHAASDPDGYFRGFFEELMNRGMEVPGEHLAWIALVNGLLRREKLIELDWKDDAGYILLSASTLLPENPRRQAIKEELNSLDLHGADLEDALPEIDKTLIAKGLTLIMLDIDADSYPLTIIPAHQFPRAQYLAASAGQVLKNFSNVQQYN